MDAVFLQLWRQLLASPEVLGLTLAVLLAAWFGFFFWARPAFNSIASSLERLNRPLADAEGWSSTDSLVDSVKVLDPTVQDAWQDSRARVIAIERPAGGTQFATLGSLRDVWNPQSLVGRSINLPLAEAIPNLLVGVGLLLTFFFLTLAIVSATAALQPVTSAESRSVVEPPADPSRRPEGALPQPQTTKAIDGAINDLLSSAGAKFLTSLAGLLASIGWTFALRLRMRRVDQLCDSIVNCLSRLAPPDAGERLATAQVALGNASKQSAEDHVALLEEVLNESREQTGVLKRFETDLAVAIGRAINAGLTPQFEEMTRRLTASIDQLTERMASINQGALEKMFDKMLAELSAILKKATDSEIAQLKESLSRLAALIEAAGVKFGETGEQANRTMAGLIQQVLEVAKRLDEASQGILNTSQAFAASVDGLSQTVDQASAAGRTGREFFTNAVERGAEQITRFRDAAQMLESTVADMGRVAAGMDEAVDAIGDLAVEQREVVHAVRDATPNAMRSIGEVVGSLKEAIAATGASMNQVRESMRQTAAVLEQTVGEIQGGVSDYSRTVADLHQKMDGYLARAIGNLGNKITSLEEVLEELSEVVVRLNMTGR